jgi:hypothetical protein
LGILDLTSRGLHWVIDQAKKEFRDYNTKQLIDQAFSAKPSVKILARARLKKDYPEIWAQLVELGEVKQ